jgi:hypothetical protein
MRRPRASPPAEPRIADRLRRGAAPSAAIGLGFAAIGDDEDEDAEN